MRFFNRNLMRFNNRATMVNDSLEPMSMFEFIKYPKISLSIMGIYPKTDSSLFYRCRTFLSMGILFSLGTCLTYYTFLEVGDFVKLSESLYMQICIINSFLKFVIITYKKENFFKCIDLLKTPSFNMYNYQYNSVIRQLKNICIGTQFAYTVQCNLSIVLYALFPVWDSKPLPLEFPHFNSGVFHYPFYIFQVVGMYICAQTNVCFDLLSVGFIIISATQLRKLNKKLIDMGRNVRNLPNYSKDNMEKLTLDYLKECCIHYSDIAEFSKYLQDCFSIISFLQMVTSCVSICNALILLLAVSPTSVEGITLISYTGCMLAEIFLYCVFGHFVYYESLEILTSCYFSSWYECSPRVRRTLFILMERTKRPIEVKGLNLITLSLDTFISVCMILKWTYSYFTLLRNFTSKHQ